MLRTAPGSVRTDWSARIVTVSASGTGTSENGCAHPVSNMRKMLCACRSLVVPFVKCHARHGQARRCATLVCSLTPCLTLFPTSSVFDFALVRSEQAEAFLLMYGSYIVQTRFVGRFLLANTALTCMQRVSQSPVLRICYMPLLAPMTCLVPAPELAISPVQATSRQIRHC